MIDHGAAGEVEGGHATRPPVDEDRHACADPDLVGLHAEISQTGHDVDVEVDQPRSHEVARAIDDLGVGVLRRQAGADGGHHPVARHHVCDRVEGGGGIDDPTPGEHQSHGEHARNPTCRIGFRGVTGSSTEG